MSEKYKIKNQDRIYFITFSVVQWINVFTRTEYKDLILENLKYCQQKKGLVIYAWCIMTNHIHLIIGRNSDHKIQDIIRDFKKYTSVVITKAIAENQQESRKEWLLWMFGKLAEKSSKHQKYCFWQNEYHPIELSDNQMMSQKLDYIHNNPILEGIVREPQDYLYSSAIDYAGGLCRRKRVA
ncbi:REP-associated tyrosine transposase [Ekhidna sp.]|uniref:REP-associated tyrosine transposase n=1 Tax=Ekhidna sp. TaxID=2608089 RepID=UPI003B5A9230